MNDDTPGPLRRRQLRLAEDHAKAVMGKDVNYDKVDWETFLPKLIDFLMMLFKLFA